MSKSLAILFAVALTIFTSLSPVTVQAHALKKQGEAVQVADSNLSVTPSRDWNRLSEKIGKNTETWTLDGGQLNDVTFFGGIEPGKPLVKERSKKYDPLPKFTQSTLLIEIPELLEGTYRTYKDLAAFTVGSSSPTKFLNREGIRFSYEFTDRDGLTRKGEAVATIFEKKLYMVTFDAPRLHYYDRLINDFRALVQSARM